MNSEKQATIKSPVSVEGVGLHTGNRSKIIFNPAPANYGIRFVRIDLPERPVIKAIFNHVTGTAVRGTTINDGIGKVHTIEHIMAACYGIGIDNLEVQIDNNEPPIMDGSAKEFVEKLLNAGIVHQEASREYITLKNIVSYSHNETSLVAYPSDALEIDCTVGYDHPLLSEQKISIKMSSDIFLKELAPARTFCFDFEIEALRSKGLARGGSFSNAIVVGLDKIHNPEPLRFQDEFVRHKALDLLGDLYLLGKPLKAKIVAVKCGHHHNIAFAKEIAKACNLFSQ